MMIILELHQRGGTGKQARMNSSARLRLFSVCRGESGHQGAQFKGRDHLRSGPVMAVATNDGMKND